MDSGRIKGSPVIRTPLIYLDMGFSDKKSCSDGETEQEMRFGDKGAVSFVVYKDTNGILKTNIENVKTKQKNQQKF